MVKLKLREVIDNNFSLALRKVTEQPLSALQSWSFVRLQKKTSEQIGAYEEARLQAIKKFAVLKEDGNVETLEGGIIKFKSDEDKAAAIQEIEELLNQEVELPEIKLEAISNLQIDTTSMSFLDRVISAE